MPQTTVQVFRNMDGAVPLLEWLSHLEAINPKAYADCIERILRLHRYGYELRRPIADALRDGIRELRIRSGTVQYRILYAFIGKNVAILTHGFSKEGRVPPSEIDLALERVSLARSDPDQYVATWSAE